MPIHIRLAETEHDIDQVFRVRHQVFCQEEDLINGNASHLVVDRFDAFPASKSFVSLDEAGRVVGSVRITLDNAIGLPAEEYFDFRSYVPEGSRLMSISMFCVAKHHRSTTVARGLLLMCGYYAMANQMDYTCMPANPTIGNMICRIGGKPLLSDLKSTPRLKVDFMPYLVPTDDMSEAFIRFARNNILYNTLPSNEYVIFRKGEQITRCGEHGDCAYLIVEGKVNVLHPATSDVISELAEGDVLGEGALFSVDGLRRRNSVAVSLVRAVALTKPKLLQHIRNAPEARAKLPQKASSQLEAVLRLPDVNA